MIEAIEDIRPCHIITSNEYLGSEYTSDSIVIITDQEPLVPPTNAGQVCVIELGGENGARSYMANSFSEAFEIAAYVLHGRKERVK